MEHFIFDLSVVLVCAALFSSLAVVLRQPIILAYILSGVLIGPWGAGWIKRVEFIEVISHLGITLLLYLAGLCLHPQKLFRLFKETTVITLVSSFVSFFISFATAMIFRFNWMDSLCIGLAMMFSSTILAVKLLPTTRLHHEKMGAICIGILIIQDLLAIAVLAFIRCLNAPQGALVSFAWLTLKLVLFLGVLVVVEQYVLRKIMAYVERMRELLFILGLAWCFGVAAICNSMGLFYETGAFFAGVVLARHPIALYISESLKPLRDFFLLLFFFTLGAKINFLVMKGIIIPAMVFSTVLLFARSWVFKKLFLWSGENYPFAKEAGIRLGQLSEFSILVAMLGLEVGLISSQASQLIQLVTIITFIVSSYVVVTYFPTPIGSSEKLNRD